MFAFSLGNSLTLCLDFFNRSMGLFITSQTGISRPSPIACLRVCPFTLRIAHAYRQIKNKFAGGKLDLTKLGMGLTSMRVRVGRNLAAYPLPGAMTQEDRINMEQDMIKVPKFFSLFYCLSFIPFFRCLRISSLIPTWEEPTTPCPRATNTPSQTRSTTNSSRPTLCSKVCVCVCVCKICALS